MLATGAQVSRTKSLETCGVRQVFLIPAPVLLIVDHAVNRFRRSVGSIVERMYQTAEVGQLAELRFTTQRIGEPTLRPKPVSFLSIVVEGDDGEAANVVRLSADRARPGGQWRASPLVGGHDRCPAAGPSSVLSARRFLQPERYKHRPVPCPTESSCASEARNPAISVRAQTPAVMPQEQISRHRRARPSRKSCGLGAVRTPLGGWVKASPGAPR